MMFPIEDEVLVKLATECQLGWLDVILARWLNSSMCVDDGVRNTSCPTAYCV
jgi:hypothetical protein